MSALVMPVILSERPSVALGRQLAQGADVLKAIFTAASGQCIGVSVEAGPKSHSREFSESEMERAFAEFSVEAQEWAQDSLSIAAESWPVE